MKKFKIYETEVISLHPFKLTRIDIIDIIVETYNDWGYYINLCDKRDIKDEMLRTNIKYSEDQKETISIVKEYLKTA